MEKIYYSDFKTMSCELNCLAGIFMLTNDLSLATTCFFITSAHKAFVKVIQLRRHRRGDHMGLLEGRKVCFDFIAVKKEAQHLKRLSGCHCCQKRALLKARMRWFIGKAVRRLITEHCSALKRFI